ncbi:hypothetical protein bpr_II133 (plasmid) [Butyrivibrio proteoclasticus B316]|uniref:Uncharacterized protein n=1 Tax=Butyrivibrio proteoclasticus (strain ATCC 51982 / DSM 14932 / B316) TaxID=515622 RepID=E0S3U0_BUTPB|nr:hypothetical protein [Butyrivibrio proteoclasticus]ADL36072.1 hypothetical protein bpr_II133 [Butyrivibrio proteoclasticus B316]
MNITDFEETKRLKARNMRYKKPIAKHMNLDHIKNTLYEIQEECENVRWYVDGDEDSLVNALDGNEDEASEFRMEFTNLCAECDKMLEDLNEHWLDEDFEAIFNNFFVAIKADDDYLGWDSFEQDYFGIEFKDIAEEEAGKKLLRMTKENIVLYAGLSFNIAMSFIGLQNRYDNLKAALDILRDENTGHIQTVKHIEELYEKIEHNPILGIRNDEEFDRYANYLPPEAWIA